MTKQELIQAAKEISDICKSRGHTWEDCNREPKCQFFDDNPKVWQCVFCIRGQDGYPPQAWDIISIDCKCNHEASIYREIDCQDKERGEDDSRYDY